MKTLVFVAASAILLTATVMSAGAEQTFTGRISDNMCAAKHEASEGQPEPEPHACTLACLKGGSKYVLVSDGKTYKITNQDLSGLDTNAGAAVRLTGELAGDSITVSKIEPAGQ